ncbi:glycoside hydrolase family 3 N-terminal domain-containing protein [Micromonospora sp. C28SCA-DRY-2]|uniref:glycoside hydrolase family 3 protein n=1 Tax=Micromonospora sp. C28SCA-DRY-2 TaxID=3059522 RepID=UPI002675B5AA|nr:glycoside hydrolase family 3 protein [Micromonospora sp. C28SCA-DRY-2]MDO3705154.1 glycoside hydrolase family 3 N-terminal domain-containing protein [Micromonospora sp. C28SCA-DRY-2]
MKTRLVIATVLVATLGTTLSPLPVQAVADSATDSPAAPPPAAEHGWVTSTLRHMSLEQKVGQLFATYVYGTDATAPTAADRAANRAAFGVETPAEVIEEFHLGAVCYFSWSHNLDSPRQIATLSNGLQRAALGDGGKDRVPLLISTDQEQGVVLRMPAPAAQFPGAMALGAGRSPRDARSAAEITGRELRAVGIHQPYAPIADVNVDPANPVIGVRSFGADPTLVAELTAAQVTGFQRDAGTTAVAKHFPGHGDTDNDSHTDLPVINHTREEWDRIDAPPFRRAIAAGVESVMTAHIVVPALDPSGDPATLSPTILSGVLRGELGFRGVIVTDALNMAGVRQKYGDERVPVLALKAGADQLLMPPDLRLARDAVLRAVATGELTERRIDESVRRILALKYRQGLAGSPLVDVEAAVRTVGAAEHLAAVTRVTDPTLTAVRNDAGLLPLARTDRSVLVTGWNSAAFAPVATVADGFAARGARATARPATLPSDQAIAATAAEAARHDLTVVLVNKAWDVAVTDPRASQRRLVAALLATGRPVVVVAVRDPYDIAYLPGVSSYLATYSYTRAAMDALVRALHGELSPRGRLPVTIPTADGGLLYPYGHGLTW